MANLLATGVNTKILVVPEVTYGTLPTGPTMTDVPFVDSNLAPVITKVTDSQIYGDGMHRYVVPTTEKVAGTISGEVSHTNFDWLATGIMYNTWALNVLKVGIVQPSYSLEVGATDISQYSLYTGMVIDKLGLTVTPAGLITYKADFVGATAAIGTVTNATTTTAAVAATPLAAATATIKEGGTVVTYITGATINFDRKTTVNYALGSGTPVRMTSSFITATGTIDAFFEDEVLFNKFKASTATSLDFTFTDGTNTYEVDMPNVVYETFTPTINGTGPVLVKMNFTAVYDPTSTSSIVITRSS